MTTVLTGTRVPALRGKCRRYAEPRFGLKVSAESAHLEVRASLQGLGTLPSQIPMVSHLVRS